MLDKEKRGHMSQHILCLIWQWVGSLSGSSTLDLLCAVQQAGSEHQSLAFAGKSLSIKMVQHQIKIESTSSCFPWALS